MDNNMNEELVMRPGVLQPPEAMSTADVHIKEEDIKKEQDWEEHAGLYDISTAAALAGLYAGHTVKDELVLGPEGVQPAQSACQLYAAQMSTIRAQPKLRGCVVRLTRLDHRSEIAPPYSPVRSKDDVQSNTNKETEKDSDVCDHGKLVPKTHLADVIHHENTKRDQSRRCALALVGEGGRRSNGERRHSSQICMKKFTKSSHLTAHDRIHTAAKPFSCKTCDKSFTLINNLKRHERIHLNERPFSCGICYNTFSRLQHLKTHELVHKRERPFACVICDKKFTELGSRKRHERTHTGERPYSCKICNKTFTDASSLKKHKPTHTEKKPYTCGVCNEMFRHLRNLKRHELSHTKAKPYYCDMCQKGFVRKYRLVAHVLAHKREGRY